MGVSGVKIISEISSSFRKEVGVVLKVLFFIGFVGWFLIENVRFCGLGLFTKG